MFELSLKELARAVVDILAGLLVTVLIVAAIGFGAQAIAVLWP
jgi:hypothetical protein